MKKKILVLSCMIVLLTLSACKSAGKEMSNSGITPTSSNNSTSSLPTPSQTPAQAGTSDTITPTDLAGIPVASIPTAVSSDANEYDVIRDGYNKGKNIAISYPQIKGLADTKRQSAINKILKQDAMSYLDDTSGLLNLEISYKITWKGNNVFSVQYYGWEEYSNDPHPYNLYFSTNINMKTGKKIKLQEIFHINQKLVNSIMKKGSYTGPLDPGDSGLMEEVNYNMKSNVTTSGLPDTIFYFTGNTFGIYVGVSHAIGDYAMIETKYSDLKSCMDSGSEVWKDFEKALNKTSGDLADEGQSISFEGKTLSDLRQFTEIKNQSFNVKLEKWGAVRFVSGKDYQGKLLFFLTDDKNIIRYQFPDYYDSYRKNQTVSGVAFRDVNKDGLKDAIIIAAGDSGHTSCDIYFQTEYSFVQIPELYHDLNQSNTVYDTVNKVINYMNKTGNAIVAKFL